MTWVDYSLLMVKAVVAKLISMCCRQPRFECSQDSRNLLKMTNDTGRINRLKKGRADVLKLLTTLPVTKTLEESLTVDLVHQSVSLRDTHYGIQREPVAKTNFSIGVISRTLLDKVSGISQWLGFNSVDPEFDPCGHT